MILFTANPDGSEAVIVQLHRTISPIPPSECAQIAGLYEQWRVGMNGSAAVPSNQCVQRSSRYIRS